MILDDIFQNHTSSLEEKTDLGPRLGTKRDQGRVLRKWHKSRLGEQDSQDMAEAIKPSDIPTSMRTNRLTMRDIEKERPQGAYRFRVGDNEFMDLDAAREFARGTGDRVQPINPQIQGNQPQNRPQTYRVIDPRDNRPGAAFANQQDAEAYARTVNGRVEPIRKAQKKNPNPRIERILKMLRARHPQAENDLEALIYDFRSQQGQDRQDISRLDAENDSEEADIDELQAMIDDLRRRRGITEKKKPVPINKPLWGRAKAAARSKFDVYPSATAVSWAAKWYRSHGGEFSMPQDKLDEKQDACYHKVRSRYKVWPSAYASGALVQCRKKGAANWGTGGKKK